MQRIKLQHAWYVIRRVGWATALGGSILEWHQQESHLVSEEARLNRMTANYRMNVMVLCESTLDAASSMTEFTGRMHAIVDF
jgi:hypothetical protein